ncbi:hypothetical protein GGX14DRAFT_557398 [Mycena pura]|uniref:Uncharacterized protein n=1 Tax=Mycena pura TaxID=153505 RepID=A0AAD6YNE1_9AGAR|nr:hypothetical protein GGX14DRAFT_557398 [Mycena pura]
MDSTTDCSADIVKSKKKPGNKGDFHGKRLAFLLEHWDEYVQHSKDGATRKFWPALWEKYYTRFGWRLTLDVEPEDGVEFGEESSLTTEEEEEKVRALKALKGKIKTWYNHQRTARGMNSNVFTPWLSRLRRPEGSAPKHITDYQFYMQHADYKLSIEEEFKQRFWDQPRAQHLSLRCQVARERFLAEPQEVKDHIRREATEEHDDELARYKEAEEGLPSVNEEDQKEARLRFSAVVAPLLQGLRAYTGFHIILVVGRKAGDVYDIVNVNAGKTKTKEGVDIGTDFAQWDEAGYKDRFLDQFVRYLAVADDVCDQSPSRANVGFSTSPAAGAESTNSTNVMAPQIATPDDPRPLDDDKEMPDAMPPPRPSMSQHTAAPAATGTTAAPQTAEPGALESRIAALPVLESPLRRELDAMPRALLEVRVEGLERMMALALQRENNLARNREGAGALPDAIHEVVVQQEREREEREANKAKGGRGKKRKAAAKGGKPKKRGRRDAESDKEDTAAETDSDVGEMEVSRAEPVQTRSRQHAAAAGAAAAGAAAQGVVAPVAVGAVDEATTLVAGTSPAAGTAPGVEAVAGASPAAGTASGTGAEAGARAKKRKGMQSGMKGAQAVTTGSGGLPKWAAEAKAVLQGPVSENWTGWKGMTDLWLQLEASTGFTSAKALPSDRHPEAVRWWIQCARKGTPPIANVAAFGVEWRNWWVSLNPKWRVGSKGELRKEKNPDDDWDVLRTPGVNRLLSVVICLKWWRQLLDGDTDDWTAAVSDVAWVITQLLLEKGDEGQQAPAALQPAHELSPPALSAEPSPAGPELSPTAEPSAPAPAAGPAAEGRAAPAPPVKPAPAPGKPASVTARTQQKDGATPADHPIDEDEDEGGVPDDACGHVDGHVYGYADVGGSGRGR